MDDFIKQNKIADETFKEWAKTVKQSEFTLDNYKQYLKDTSKQTSVFTNFTSKAKTALKSLGASLASMAVNTAITIFVSSLIKLSQVSDEVAEKASNLGESYNDTKSSIEDYKNKVEDLYKTINDSNSSVEEVTEARKNLMSVQDELITKFGTEKETINNITSAINGQTDAWNRLTYAQWQATKNEFNNSDFFNNVGNWFNGYSNNIDRMISEMEKSHIYLDQISWFDPDNVDLFNALKDAGYINSQHDILALEGNLENIYEDILNIQNIAKEYNAPAVFLKELTKEANKSKETIDSYGNMWDNYILNDRIFEDDSLANNWKSINDAYSKYQDAILSGSSMGIENAIVEFASSLDVALSNSNADESVQEYFSDMYPTLVAEVEKWKFKTAILPMFDTANIGGLSSEQILKEIQTDGLQAAEETFNSILEIASEYGIVSGNNTQKVQQLLELLVEWGILQEDIVESARTYSYSVFDQSAFNDTIKSYEEGYDKLVAVQEEWNESKAISASTFADLQENGLLQYLQFTSEGLTINKEKLLENAQACKDKAVADLHAAMTSDMLAIAVGDTSNISQTAQTVITELGKNTEIAGNQALSSVANWATLGETISTVLSSAGVEGISTDQQKQMSAVYDYYKKMATDISNIDITYKSSGKLKKSTKDATKTFNWVETALSRIQRTITNLGKAVSATYKKWGTRNNALAQEMSAVNQEITAQQNAYDTYMSKANSIALPEHYKNLVRNGGMSISDITDEKIAENIKLYQDYYEKALDASDAVEDLRANLAELAMTNFDHISKQYDDMISLIEHRTSMLNGYISQSEAAGFWASEVYYQKLADTELENINQLQSQYNDLIAQFNENVNNGYVEKYSEAWYEMYQNINDVEQALQDANTALIEYNQTLQQIRWDLFDRGADYKNNLVEESNFLIDALDNYNLYNDDGSLTDHGLATQGLHAVNYNAYMEQAISYADEIQKINEEIANDPNDLTLIDRRNELIELQQEAIKNSIKEKESIQSLYEDGYNKMLDSLQKVIDKRKELLNSQKD